MSVPKKVQAVLERLGIKNVVDGYTTRTPHFDFIKRVKGESIAAFTCWNKKGEVVCSLVKPPGCEWMLPPA